MSDQDESVEKVSVARKYRWPPTATLRYGSYLDVHYVHVPDDIRDVVDRICSDADVNRLDCVKDIYVGEPLFDEDRSILDAESRVLIDGLIGSRCDGGGSF